MQSSMETLCSIFQDDRSIEAYMEEFLLYSHLSTCSEVQLMDLFWSGLDPHVAPWIPVGDSSFNLESYLELVLSSCGSSYTVGVPSSSKVSLCPKSNQGVTIPSALKRIFNSSDLTSKLFDPSLISVRGALQYASHKISPAKPAHPTCPPEPALHGSPAEPALHVKSADTKAVCAVPAAKLETENITPAERFFSLLPPGLDLPSPLVPSSTVPSSPLVPSSTEPSSPLVPSSTEPSSPLVPSSTEPSPLVPSSTELSSPLVPSSSEPSSPLVPSSSEPSSPLVPSSSEPSSPLVPSSSEPSSPLVLPSTEPSPLVLPSTEPSPLVLPSTEPSPLVLPSTEPSPLVLPSTEPSPLDLPSHGQPSLHRRSAQPEALSPTCGLSPSIFWGGGHRPASWPLEGPPATRRVFTAVATRRGFSAVATRRGFSAVATRRGFSAVATRRGFSAVATRRGFSAVATRRGFSAVSTSSVCSALEASCHVSPSASRAPTLPPLWSFYGARTRLPGGGSYVTVLFCLSVFVTGHMFSFVLFSRHSLVSMVTLIS
ncbi:hypothetical protein PO909_010348 [Leuciscus waleckii]